MANTFTNFYPTLFQDVAYFEFAAAAIAPQVLNMTWVDPGGPSDAIRIPKFVFGTSGIQDVSALFDAPTDVSEATLVLNLNVEKGFHFQVRYGEQDRANVRLGEAVLRQRAAALASVMDSDTFLEFLNASTVLSGQVNKTTCVSAIEVLNEQNAPMTDRVLVTNPDGYSDLLRSDDFVRADSVQGADSNRTGLVGTVLGLEVFLSNNMPPVASGCDAVIMHRAAVALAMLRSIDVRVFDQPRHFAVGYTGRAQWGKTTIDPDLMVRIDRP